MCKYHVYTLRALTLNPLQSFVTTPMYKFPSMKCLGIALGLLLSSCVAVAETAYVEPPVAVYPTIDYGTGPEAEQVKRGEYLSKAGDCIACHTVAGGKSYAGGLGVETPFGTIYSPNITPDKKTGIGDWSLDDFDRAMRHGISKNGDYLFAVFPYTFYTKLSRQDVADIKAYLNKIPAVEQANRPLDMPFPFKVRMLQSFWRFMFFDFQQGEFVPDERQSDEWNRGAYLVEGLTHCAMCHTPINALGSWKREYDLTGGSIAGYHAPNISASRLQDVPVEKIVDVFLHDKTLQGGQVQGPMLEVNHNSLRHLTVEDLRAIATYIKTVKSKTPPVPDHGTGEKAGKAIYDQYCGGCHNMGGGGAPKFGSAAQWDPLVERGLNQLYTNAIRGVDGMPPKGNCDSCTNEQVHLAVDYIIKHSKGKPGGAAKEAADVAAETSIDRGKHIYDQTCVVCHKDGQLGAPRLGDKTAWTPLLKENLDVIVARTIHGYKAHPPRGACYLCSDADVISAVKYMAQEGSTGGADYSLW